MTAAGNATQLFTLQWLSLCYMNFTSIFKNVFHINFHIYSLSMSFFLITPATGISTFFKFFFFSENPFLFYWSSLLFKFNYIFFHLFSSGSLCFSFSGILSWKCNSFILVWSGCLPVPWFVDTWRVRVEEVLSKTEGHGKASNCRHTQAASEQLPATACAGSSCDVALPRGSLMCCQWQLWSSLKVTSNSKLG